MNPVYHPLNYSVLSSNLHLTQELAKFYCNIWENDERFDEYRKCPICNKYFGKKTVEIDGITTCCGDDCLQHSEADLIPVWNPESVAKNELLGDSLMYGNNFFGVYATNGEFGKIIGFTWGWLETADCIEKRWKKEIATALGNSSATYYSEIACDPGYRERKIGKELLKKLIQLFQESEPNLPSFLRTHKDSVAKTMFQKAGYQYFAEDPEHGCGRIMMMIKKAKDLTY